MPKAEMANERSMRPFYAELIAHCIASYCGLAEFFLWYRWVRGDARRIADDDVVELVLYPVLEPILIPYYSLSLLSRFEWLVFVHLVTYAVAFTMSYSLLRRLRRRPNPGA